MPKVTWFHSDGRESQREVPAGISLMTAATQGDIEGIVGDCGGVMSCATCHVVVDDAFVHSLPPMTDTENQMLDYTAMPREPNSRLSCQIVVNDSLDGIRIRIADPQL